MTGFVDFVEDKWPDPLDLAQTLARTLAPAVAANRHANFGPVCTRLEAALSALNGAAPGRACVATANGTLALLAAVAAFDNHLGRRLRWAVSDFSFFTAFLGPFQGAIPVSCKGDGMIDLAALEAVPDAAYDAILVTNVFGLAESFGPVFDFAALHGKALLIDNAAGFGALAPYHRAEDLPLWAEAISLHHTKPWGMGEGGAVFLGAELAPLARAAVNFGAGLGRPLADTRLCTNAKMSEIAAAQCLIRVEGHGQWAPPCRQQAARLTAIAENVGLRALFPDPPRRAVPGQVAVLAGHAVALRALENPVFRIRKYYRPSPGAGRVARDLYARILNLPCHAGMAAIADETVAAVLERALRGARAAA